MHEPATAPTLSSPRWDGRRILFEIVQPEGDAACTISVDAVQALSGKRSFRSADLLQQFEAVREQIAEVAIGKWRARSAAASGLTFIWSSDLPESASEIAATMGSTGRRRGDTSRHSA